MRKFIVAGGMAVVAACGGGGGGSDAPKDLFSLWNEKTTNAPMDMRGGTFSSPMAMQFFFAGGAQCSCTLTLIGEQSAGSWALNSCSYVPGSGSEDPGCNSLNDTGTYKKTSDTLTITPSSGVSSVYQ